jgi:hypothetical protein
VSRVDELIAGGFKQVSRKYRHLARLPPGKTGLEALAEVDPRLAAHFLARANESAEMMFLRVHHADGPDHVTLTVEEFKEYLGKTGRSSSTCESLLLIEEVNDSG